MLFLTSRVGYVYDCLKGIWGGMIFGGTAIQTAVLAIITMRCDWDKEVIKNFFLSLPLNLFAVIYTCLGSIQFQDI